MWPLPPGLDRPPCRCEPHGERAARRVACDGAARCGFFQHGICSIDPALWLRPFAKKSSRAKLVVGNEIRNADDLLDFTVMQAGNRIEFPIGLRVKPHKVRIDPGLIMDVAAFAD